MFKFSVISQSVQKEIVEKAKQGDEYAIHHLYRLYAKAMLNTAFRILNNREDAEDVLQESFLKAFSSLHQFRYQSTFGAWIRRIVVNKSIDALKQKKKYIFLSDSSGSQEGISPEIAWESAAETSIRVDQLYAAVQELPDGYRTVFSLYMLEGYDHKEIAAILNIGVSSSISQLSRAKNKLKLKLLSTLNAVQ